MLKIGLKLWSINTDAYLSEAVRLYEQGVYEYIELFIVPDTLDYLCKWKQLKIPFIVHNAHSATGFNAAKKEMAERNRQIYEQTKKFADELDAKYIIFHGGVDGDICETARQLALFAAPRALIENKPYLPIAGKVDGKYCRGATIDEIKYVMAEAKCGLCLDIGHAVCAANYQKIEPYSYIQQLNLLKPKMYHLSDVTDMTGVYDAHPHLGTGHLDIRRLKQEIFPSDAVISIETVKDSKENLNDFERDALWLKSL